MKKYPVLLQVIASSFTLLFTSCGPNAEEKVLLEKAMEKSAHNLYMSSSDSTNLSQKTSRQFVRTADVKFKTNDVLSATSAIEQIVNKNGGFVTNTELSNDVTASEKINFKIDSTLVATHYTMRNTMTLRIPNHHLDSALKQISKEYSFLDYRHIKAEDVSLILSSNNLTQKRTEQTEKRILKHMENNGKKLNQTLNAEQMLYEEQQKADEALISNLNLEDQVAFSTVILNIYENEKIKTEILPLFIAPSVYEPSFIRNIADSFQYGWNMFLNLILLIVKLWLPLLILITFWLLIKKQKISFNHKNTHELK